MYKWRHLIESYFQQLKEFRHIATRYAKTDNARHRGGAAGAGRNIPGG
jgi:hypothetical protein